MIVHIVAWKYRKEISAGMRDEHIQKLTALPGVIEEILAFDVGKDMLCLDRSYDTGLVARFRDRAALDLYTDHPAHRKVAELGKRIAEHVISVDFLVE